MQISLWDPLATPDIIITRTGEIKRRNETPIDQAWAMVDGVQRHPTLEQILAVYELTKKVEATFAKSAKKLEIAVLKITENKNASA